MFRHLVYVGFLEILGVPNATLFELGITKSMNADINRTGQ
jgi:hypothetical protein